jgi:hypothetical protein
MILEGTMNALRRIGKFAFVCALGYLANCGLMVSQAAPAAAAGQEQARDGQHDFDFELGRWKIHLKRRLHPLTGSTTWVEFDGTSVTRKVWDGRSQLEEFETDSPAAGHLEGLTLRLYDPQSHQWRLYWANGKDGTVVPPQIGEFRNGSGEFYGQDTLNGKNILIRFIWSNTNTDVPHFEQSFSSDGGKSWEVNWITDQTRVPEESAEATPAPGVAQTDSGAANATIAERDGQHDFDFNFGTWRTDIKRLSDPLTGSKAWIELNGTVRVRKVWNGRGQLEEIEADGPNGHWEGLTLFLYNPQSHQWSQSYANRKDGILDTPSIGEFKNGRGELFDQETFNGRAVLLRAVWSDIMPDSHHFEQAFSDDGGKTWEPNFVATLAREKQ